MGRGSRKEKKKVKVCLDINRPSHGRTWLTRHDMRPNFWLQEIQGNQRMNGRSLPPKDSKLRRDVATKVLPQAFTRDASSRNGSRRLSSLRQQSQPLFVIHGVPWDKFLAKHIHSAKESQLEEKLHKIQVSI